MAKTTTKTQETQKEEAPREVPSFTIRADSVFGLRCMIAVAGLSAMLSRAEQHAIAMKLREFDLYDEANR